LRSLKSLRAISSSREVSGASSSSSKIRSTIGNLSEGSPCFYIGDGGLWDEPSDKEADGDEDGIGNECGVTASLDEDEDVLA
jgi:hypothetical protein